MTGPTVTGWLMVLAYAVAAGLCGAAASERRDPRGRRVWWLLAATLAVLGANRLFDLQMWLTESGRDIALTHGWYEGRRALQIGAVAALGAIGLALAVAVPILLRGLEREARWAAAGTVALGVFVVIRAVSWHTVDGLLAFKPLGLLSVNAVLEAGAIGVVAVAAWRRRRRSAAASSSRTSGRAHG